MSWLSDVLVFVVAVLHVAFFVLEAVLWTRPGVRRIFGNSEEQAQTTRVLALNQGWYNLGLALILVWLHLMGNPAGVLAVLLFLVAMGIVGAITASRSILVLQALPAAAAAALVWVSG
jgi:putative membrane protein